MRTRPSLWFVPLVVVVAIVLTWGVEAQPDAPRRVFDEAPGLQSFRSFRQADDVMPQARRVRPRPAELARAGQERMPIQIPLPSGIDVIVAVSTSETQSRGLFVAGPIIRSSVAGAPVEGEAALTVVDGVMAGRIVFQGQLYRVREDAGTGGWHVIEAVSQSDFPLEGQPLEVPPLSEPDERTRMQSATDTAGDSAAFVDLLLVYTPAARVAMGGTSAVRAEIQSAVNNANLALGNSGVTHRYRSAYVGEVAYTESGSSNTDLSRVRLVTDGFLDEVHVLRDVHQADVVALLTYTANANECGLGYVMGPSVTPAFRPFAFNVTKIDCAAGNLTLAHEIGHNVGLQHDRDNAGSVPGFSFAYGYRVPGLARTVMSYACEVGQPCPRRTIFSTPSAVFPSTSTTAGTPTEDNARALNLTALTVANFRDSTCVFTVTPAVIRFTLTGGSSTVTVATGSDCAWTAVSGDPAVSVLSGASVTGSGTMTFSVAAAGTPRVTTLHVAGQVVAIRQDSCAPEMFVSSGTPAPFTRLGGTGSITFSFPTGCESTTWTASVDMPWVTWTSPTSGAGSGTASFSVAANGTEDNRGAIFTFTGAGSAPVTRTIQQLGSRLVVAIPSRTLRAAKGNASAPLQAYTPQQRVTVTMETPDARAWTAVSDQPWLQVMSGSGTGTGGFVVRVANPDNVIGGATQLTANVTVSASGFTPQVWPFTLQVRSLAESGGPFGFFDTPIGGTTVSGAIPVTGWVLGSENIVRVDVWRDSIPGLDTTNSVQPNGWVYVGQATQIAGARPDVAAAFATYPQRNQAGWGHMVLTNMLPHQPRAALSGGQGTFRLHITANQHNGVQMQLGEVEIHVDNDAATRPFGTIDTPGQGGVVSSTVANFGWALARGAGIVPTDASTMVVFMDGLPVGRPVYNQCRGSNLAGGGSSFLPPGGTCDDDIATVFAAGGHQNIAPGSGRGAIGAYVFDSTTMSDGVHTIAWSVTDSLGRVEGIGSRIFSVSNAGGAPNAAWLAEQPVAVPDVVRADVMDARHVHGRRGFDLAASWEVIDADHTGTRYLRVRELDRVELDLGGPIEAGYLWRGEELVALPAGSSLDAATGRFAWTPAPGFLGRFSLEFVTTRGRVPVTIDLVPQTLGPAHEGVRMHVDSAGRQAGAVIAGWALDPGAWQGAGIGAVHIWAQPADPREAAVFLGAANLGGARPDVADAFGPQFDRAGWSLTVPSWFHTRDAVITVYVWSTRTGRWEDAQILRNPWTAQ